MKMLFYTCVSIFFLIMINSCEDNSPNQDINTFRKLTMTIYSFDNDSNRFVKESEYYFDGDVNSYLRRTFMKMLGNSNYKSELSQQRANVPLPLYKYGCQIKNIEYSNDGSYFAITTYKYDDQGYMNKETIDSYSDINKTSYATFQRDGDKLLKINLFEDNVLDLIIEFFYDSDGLCILQVDSSVQSNEVKKTIRRYNDKKELIYVLWGDDTSSGDVTEYFYDNDGNITKLITYTKESNDTSNTQIYNWVMYKGYRMKQEDIDNYEFDSNNNIISYINDDFGNRKYKIEYEFY